MILYVCIFVYMYIFYIYTSAITHKRNYKKLIIMHVPLHLGFPQDAFQY